jgi:outer membrane protein OmpA-like peptidoglycan-associated protein
MKNRASSTFLYSLFVMGSCAATIVVGGGCASNSERMIMQGALHSEITGDNELGRQTSQTKKQTAEELKLENSHNRQVEENQKILEEIKRTGTIARTSERGIVVDLPDVFFEFNKARIRPDASQTIRKISDIVLTNSRYRPVAVEGHTDSVGTLGYNRRLSMMRARAVAHEMVAYGFNPRQIAARGFGESRPVSSNLTDAGRSQNRRVEVIIENYR